MEQAILHARVYPTARPCSSAFLQRNMGSCRGLNCTVNPLSVVLHCTSTRRASSRYVWKTGTGTRKPPKQRIREIFLCAAPAHVHSARAAFAAGAQHVVHTQPALRTGLMTPAWRLLHVSWRIIHDFLTCGLAVPRRFDLPLCAARAARLFGSDRVKILKSFFCVYSLRRN